MLSATCSACQRVKQRKTLAYDSQLRAYCMNVCCPDHPNSPMSLKKRGQYADLMTYQEATDMVATRANALYKSGAIAGNKRQRAGVEVTQTISDTISFRIRDDAHAEYIMYIMGREGYNKVSQAIQSIINIAILSDQAFLSQTAGLSNLSHIPVKDVIENKLQAEKPAPPVQDEEVFEV